MKKTYLGFTLMKLLICMVIIAIISCLSVPWLNNMVIKQRRASAEKNLLSALNYTRGMAISYNQVVTICPSSDKKNCTNDWQQQLIIYIDNDAKGILDPNDKMLRVFAAIEHGTLQFKAFPTNRYFRFSRNGFADNQNGTFTYCYQQQGWQIIINRGGRIRSQLLLTC